jgi:hypothetical protein
MIAPPSHTPYLWHYPPSWGSISQRVGRNLHNAIVMTGVHVRIHIDALCHVGNKGALDGEVVGAEACQVGYLKLWVLRLSN